jgi:hypothetical protein
MVVEIIAKRCAEYSPIFLNRDRFSPILVSDNPVIDADKFVVIGDEVHLLGHAPNFIDNSCARLTSAP